MKANKIKIIFNKISKLVNNLYFYLFIQFITFLPIILNAKLEFIGNIGYKNIEYIYLIPYIFFHLFYLLFCIFEMLFLRMLNNIMYFILYSISFIIILYLIIKNYNIIF